MKYFIHPILKLWIRVTSCFFFEKIEITGKENIPKECPVLFAANHPDSFLDSLVMTICVGRSLYYTARGDIFNSKIASALLGSIQILPVFRREEGKENLHKNDETFSNCIKLFKKNGAVSIFSEGLSINEWNLRPLRKGTARLAYEAWNNQDIGDKLKIVPVAIHYSSWLKICPRVTMEFLKNWDKKDFETIDSGQFNRKFNDDLKAVLSEKCIVVDKSGDIESQNKVIGFILKNLKNGVRIAKRTQDKYLAQNNENLKSAYKTLSDYLTKENIIYFSESEVGIITFILSGFVCSIAYLLNFMPYKLTSYFVRKNTKDIDFYDSILFCILLVVYPFYLVALFSFFNHYFHFFTGISVSALTALSALLYEKSKRNVQCYLKNEKLKIVKQMLNSLFETSNG